MKISVVLPARGEGSKLLECLEHLRSLGRELELVVVQPREEPAPPGCLVAQPEGEGRGAALDAGVGACSGEVVLFLHVDTRLPACAFERVEQALAAPGAVGGWFRRRLDDPRWRFRWVDLGANGFSWLTGIATGDQAIFCRRESYLQVGPLASFPLFEDMTLCRRLRRLGSLASLEEATLASARRFHRKGVAPTVGTNLWLTLRYLLGAPPRSLYRAYYRSAGDGAT